MLVDTHAHLAWEDFAADLDVVLARAAEAGVGAIVTIGIDLPSSERCLALAERHPQVWAAVGIHPNDARVLTDAEWARLEELGRHPRAVAIGETGLDFYRDTVTPAVQEESFRRQLEIARRLDRPVVIHCRDAFARTLEILRPLAPVSGVMHCFSGDEAIMNECLTLGLYISFAGPVTYPKSDALRRAAAAAPADRILVETDCPFLAPQDRRGKRNEPAYAAMTARRVAQVRGLAESDFARLSTENACRLFRGLRADGTA